MFLRQSEIFYQYQSDCEKLTNLQQFLKQLLDQLPTGILITSLNFELKYSNSKMNDQLALDLDNHIDKVIEINVDEDILLKRITKRALESKISRDDDNSAILKNRILVYKKDTLPVLEYYKNLNKLHSIDGVQNVEDVSKDIQKILT